MTPKTYRFRLHTRITSVVAIILFVVMFVMSFWIFILRAKDWTSYLWGAGLLYCWWWALRRHAWQALHSATYSLEVGTDWVAMRDMFSFRIMPFAQLGGFAEEPMTHEGKLSGYRFGFLSTDIEPITFSTQIVGWADAIMAVHRVLRDRVPDPRTLQAHILTKVELPPEAGLATAPAHDTPREWQALPR